jgi:hypothetical protein
MSAGWTLALLAVGTVIAVVTASWRRRVEAAELGTMSTRWIAEYQATESHSYAGR